VRHKEPANSFENTQLSDQFVAITLKEPLQLRQAAALHHALSRYVHYAASLAAPQQECYSHLKSHLLFPGALIR
jgi:hypothetical protein